MRVCGFRIYQDSWDHMLQNCAVQCWEIYELRLEGLERKRSMGRQ